MQTHHEITIRLRLAADQPITRQAMIEAMMETLQGYENTGHQIATTMAGTGLVVDEVLLDDEQMALFGDPRHS